MFVNPGIVNLICNKNMRSLITESHDRSHKMGFAGLDEERVRGLDLTNWVLMVMKNDIPKSNNLVKNLSGERFSSLQDKILVSLSSW